MARKHRISQNFLRSPRIALMLVGHSNIRKRDFTLDIGAGSGVFTFALSKKSAQVLAIEFDGETFKKLKNNTKKMLELFNSVKEELDEKTQREFLARIEELENSNESDRSIVKTLFDDDKENINNGFNKFNINKVIQVISFFANNITMLSKTKLNKLLFYSDFSYFSEYTTSITGMTYIHDHYGPVPKMSEILYGLLSDEEKIRWHLFPNEQGEFITCDEEITELNEDELEVLNKVLLNFKNDNAQTISNKSHEEEAWIETRLKQVIPYDYARTLIYK